MYVCFIHAQVVRASSWMPIATARNVAFVGSGGLRGKQKSTSELGYNEYYNLNSRLLWFVKWTLCWQGRRQRSGHGLSCAALKACASVDCVNTQTFKRTGESEWLPKGPERAVRLAASFRSSSTGRKQPIWVCRQMWNVDWLTRAGTGSG